MDHNKPVIVESFAELQAHLKRQGVEREMRKMSGTWGTGAISKLHQTPTTGGRKLR